MRGVHIPGLDRVFRREIEAAGKWHGRGPAVAVDQNEIYRRTFAAARTAGLDEKRADLEARRQIAGCSLHELAHAIVSDGDGEDGILSNGPEIAKKAFDNFLRHQRGLRASPVAAAAAKVAAKVGQNGRRRPTR